jgi:hypothetical protein
VTADAFRVRKRDRDLLDMTVRTFDLRMRAIQWEIRIDVMIEAHIEPLGSTMAVIADRTVDAVVVVVFPMA